MALSQDEQRILAEIERRLASDDPGLASSLTTFRRPRTGKVLRSPRARIVGSLFTVLLVAMISLTVYAMIPLRAHIPRSNTTPPTAGAQVNTAISTAASTPPPVQQAAASLSSGVRSTTSQGSSSRSTATGKPKAKATNSAMLPQASPVQHQTVAASP